MTLKEFKNYFQQDMNDLASTLIAIEDYERKTQYWNEYIYWNDLNTTTLSESFWLNAAMYSQIFNERHTHMGIPTISVTSDVLDLWIYYENVKWVYWFT